VAIAWFFPSLGVVGLVMAGPVCAIAMILGGNAVRRAL
jgi:hypothetical protein